MYLEKLEDVNTKIVSNTVPPCPANSLLYCHIKKKIYIKMFILHADKSIFLLRKQKVLSFPNHNSCSVRAEFMVLEPVSEFHCWHFTVLLLYFHQDTDTQSFVFCP